MPGLIHGIQLLPVVFDQIMTSRGYQRLSFIYYITNYATKDDISPEQMLAKAALLKQSIEKARMAEHPTAAETHLWEKGMDQFALRCFNTLANHREISGVQVTNTYSPSISRFLHRWQ